VHDWDELRTDPDREKREAPREPMPDAPTARILELQQSSGNAAVTRLVQRRERPQSTDAPGAGHGHGHAPAKPKTLQPNPEVEKFRSLAEKVEGIQDALRFASDAQEEKKIAKAIAMYERAYELGHQQAIGLTLYRLYKELGDAAHADHWMRVFHGEHASEEAAPPVESQQF
jgi:hypothetical protein